MDFNKRGIFILVSILILTCLPISLVEAGFIETDFKERIGQTIQKREEAVILAYDISIKEVDMDNIQQLIKKTIKEADDYTASAVNKWKITIKGTTEEIELNIKFDYHRSLEMDEYVFNQVQHIYDEIISDEMVIDKKIKTISDYITNNVVYDETLDYNSAYKALKFNMSACEGYAQLTYLLLKKAGIENVIIKGWLNGPHAWNIIKIENEWYHLDTTQIAGHLNKHGKAVYNEYLITDKALAVTHYWQENTYPQADTPYSERLQGLKKENDIFKKLWEDLNLHYLEGEKTVSSHKELEEKITRAFREQKRQISFRTFKNVFSVSALEEIILNLSRGHGDVSSFEIEIFPLYLRDEREDSLIVECRFSYRNN